TPKGLRDCRVNLDGIPTVHCFHQHCAVEVSAATRELRTEILTLKQALGCDFFVAVALDDAYLQRYKDRRRRSQLADEARSWLPRILNTEPWPTDQIQAETPTSISGVAHDHWRLHLGLFQAHDVIWIGADVRDTGRRSHIDRFRNVRDWLRFSH